MLAIEVASDVICPWCYIGKRRLEKALTLVKGEIESHIVWLPFQLNPDMPAEGVPRAEYRKAKFGSLERSRALDARVAAEGEREGIAFAFERMTRTPNTLRAHQLIELAQRQGRGNWVVDALFRAYFEEACDVGDAGVLASVAAACEVDDWPQAADAAAVSALQARVRALGINAVPTFILQGLFVVSGAHPPESLAEAMRQAASEAERRRASA